MCTQTLFNCFIPLLMQNLNIPFSYPPVDRRHWQRSEDAFFWKILFSQGIPYPPITFTITIGVHVLLGFDKMCWGRSEMVSKKRISRFTGWMINIPLWCSINVSLMNSAQVCVWYITVWINQVSIDVQITISKMRKLHLGCFLAQQITPHDADQW